MDSGQYDRVEINTELMCFDFLKSERYNTQTSARPYCTHSIRFSQAAGTKVRTLEPGYDEKLLSGHSEC